MRRAVLAGGLSLITAAVMVALPAGTSGAAGGPTRAIPAGGTTSIRVGAQGPDGLQQPELRPGGEEDEAGAINRARPGFKNGKFPKKPLDAPTVASSVVASSNPDVVGSAVGLTHRDQRLANGGNQFSLEPPDQGLCVGGGFVVEAVNSVIRVRNSTTGAALTGAGDLSSFFGYPAAINRTTGAFGPDVIDPVCHFDPDNNRFVVVITTLHRVGTTAEFNGKNTIDLAVSNTGDPTGAWTVYHVPAQNDGTDGTPNHGCTTDGTTPGPCFQDYPHIGGDRNGIYVTTNEYDLFGPSFNAAQVFAFSKSQLAAHPASIDVTPVENLQVDGSPGFTVWPATSPAGQYSSEANGTEYLLSTIAGDGSETGNPTGTARRIGMWAITNTATLNTSTPALRITSRLTNSQAYVFPPKSDQKPGNIPLGECINNTTTPTPFGPGCWQVLFNPPEPAHNEVESTPDSNDTRMQQTWYVNGTIWGATDTAVWVDGQLKAGIAWFAVSPKINGSGKVEGRVTKQGYLALARNNLTYPAIAMTPSGKGVIAFTVLGQDYYPSAGYARIDASGNVGPIHIAAPGLGPDDGFTSYKAFVGDPPRTRWGDYGAAVTDGDTLWLASEYIGQTCTYAQYYPNPPSLTNFGSCGATRTSLANWYTHLTKLDANSPA